MQNQVTRYYSELRYHPNPTKTQPDPLPRCCVFLPASCKTAGPYRVLYLLHGVGDTEYSWEVNGNVSGLVNELIQDGQIDPVIVVMPFGFVKEEYKLSRTFPKKEEFDSFLNGAMEKIEARYPEIDKTRRALAGLSMGGKQTLEYALNNPGKFEALGAFSAALHREEAIKEVQAQLAPQADNLRKLRALYVSCGAQDEVGEGALLKSNRTLEESLKPLGGIRLQVDWKRGKHDWGVWKGSLRQFLSFWMS
jgi:enterochelin esterase-like enzyme